jgi:hypothetical protein
MTDVVFVVITIAFFALAALFVYACDRIVGADAVTEHEPAPTPAAEDELAA